MKYGLAFLSGLLSSVSGVAPAQTAPPEPIVSIMPSPEHLAEVRRNRVIGREHLERFLAREAKTFPARIRLQLRGTPLVEATLISEAKLREIVKNCAMDDFSGATSREGGENWKGFQSRWSCPEGSPDPAPFLLFAIAGDGIDDVRVKFGYPPDPKVP